MDKFRHIDTWVFDLDGTLYDAESYVFVECGRRMTEFVAQHVGIDMDSANQLRNQYYKKYGTTLRGLMTEHGIPPEGFLQHIHDIDLAPVETCKITQDYLTHLPGRKFIFTNAPRPFADRMTAHLGINHHFDGIFAIEDADYWPKPDIRSYQSFLKKHNINPKTACMFEDMQINLKPAHDLGMSTVWFHWHRTPDDHDHVHDRAEKLPHWLLSNIHPK